MVTTGLILFGIMMLCALIASCYMITDSFLNESVSFKIKWILMTLGLYALGFIVIEIITKGMA